MAHGCAHAAESHWTHDESRGSSSGPIGFYAMDQGRFRSQWAAVGHGRFDVRESCNQWELDTQKWTKKN
jgi:hypothetical protein